MPIDWSLQVLEAHLKDSCDATAEACITHMSDLDFEPRENILDALMDAPLADFPVVLVGDHVACVGCIDLDAVRELALHGPAVA
jgi:hypothetical protein